MVSSSEASSSGERPSGPAVAVILAAGVGSRLRPYTIDLPKALLPVGGVTLLERQLERLAAVGVRGVVVVGGHGWRSVKALLDAGHESGRWGMDVELAVNVDYRSTGTAHSLRLALAHTGSTEAQEFIVVEGDVLLSDGALERLIDPDVGHDDVRILASRRRLESSLIRAGDAGAVTQIVHAADQCQDAPTAGGGAEFYNLSCYRFTMSLSLKHVLDESLEAAPKVNIERVINDLCGVARVRLAVVNHEWAIEVDTLEDLEVAQRHVERGSPER